MKLTCLQDGTGRQLWVNTEKVLAVATDMDTDVTFIILEGDVRVPLKGSPGDVARALDGGAGWPP